MNYHSDTLPINVMLEPICIKVMLTLLHSSNIIVKYVIRSAVRSRYSTVGENFKYLRNVSHKPTNCI